MAAAGAPPMWTVPPPARSPNEQCRAEPFAGRVEPFADASGKDRVPIVAQVYRAERSGPVP
jgi:hypothetical protein